MNTPINTRLAVIDALAWPIGLSVVVLRMGDEIGMLHGMAILLLGLWGLRKLGWALDGYRDEDWIVNPLSPVALVLGLLLRQDGPYSYTTTTVLVWGLSLVVLGLFLRWVVPLTM